jgi:hypothetical protein
VEFAGSVGLIGSRSLRSGRRSRCQITSNEIRETFSLASFNTCFSPEIFVAD